MSEETASAATNLLLRSLGDRKLLLIYGAEPLLYWNLVKKIILDAKRQARQMGKTISISLGTNAILFGRAILQFLKSHDVRVSLTLDGPKEAHDRYRRFANSHGSFNAVTRKLPILFAEIPNRKISALCCVHPQTAAASFDNFSFLCSQGFRNINLEPIEAPGILWSQISLRDFSKSLVQIANFILNSVKNGDFIFLNTVNREILSCSLSDSRGCVCPVARTLQVYPKGEMTFTPFLFNSSRRSESIVGRIPEGLSPRYQRCNYDERDSRCRACLSNYLNGRGENAQEALSLRNAASIQIARAIRRLATNNPVFSRYLEQARERVFE